MNTIKTHAIAKYLRISSHKVRRVLDQIRGKNYNEAKLILGFMPYRSCQQINKVLESAFNNMKQINQDNLNKDQLIIKSAFVNEGPTLKRFQPRAQGRAFPIHKPTCHITIQLESIVI